MSQKIHQRFKKSRFSLDARLLFDIHTDNELKPKYVAKHYGSFSALAAYINDSVNEFGLLEETNKGKKLVLSPKGKSMLLEAMIKNIKKC